MSNSVPVASIGGGAPFLSVKVGGLSPPDFESGGAQAPPTPPISPPLTLFFFDDGLKEQVSLMECLTRKPLNK